MFLLILVFLSSSCVPPVASDQRSSGFLEELYLYYIYACEGALLRYVVAFISAQAFGVG